MRSFLAAALALASSQALAQDKPLSVFFQPGDEPRLNQAIVTAMADAGFVLAAKPAPGVLNVVIAGKVDVSRGRISGTSWSFAVNFSRDGSSLGRSEEGCNEQKLAECTDQLIRDIRSVAGMP